MLWKRIMMVKVIRFPFQSNQPNIYVSKRKKKRNLTNFIQKKKKKMERWKQKQKIGGSLGTFPLAFEILLNKAPVILKQKWLKY